MYVKIYIILVFLLASAGGTLAQNGFSDSVTTSRIVYRALIFWPGISSEYKIDRKTSLSSELRITGFYQKSITQPNSPQVDRYAIYPYLTASIRRFYNLNRRFMRGKNIRSNSGDYLSVRGQYLFSPIVKKNPNAGTFSGSMPVENIPAFGIAWGLQRTYKNQVYFNINLGTIISKHYKQGYGVLSDFMIGYCFYSR